MSWMPGGFLGVDLFFVISGFLITTLLLRERESTGRIDLKAFWIRRFRRLVPALLLVLLAIAAYIQFVARKSTHHSLSWDGLATLGYFANWRFIVTKQSYFASFGPPTPLKHMWSLAVEEQWYLLWPLLFGGLYALLKGRRNALLVTVLALAAVSMVVMRALTPYVGDPGRAYYGTDARAHTLLLGSALALALHHRSVLTRLNGVVVQIVGALGLLYVAFAFLHFHDGDRFLYRKGGFALFAVATAAVILAAVRTGPGPIQRLLSPAPLRFIGRISYGLYLWHWPIDVYLTADRVGRGGKTLFVCRLAATFGAALLSYKFVEVPVRRGRTWSRRAMSISGATAGCMAGLLVLTSVTGTQPTNAFAAALAVAGEIPKKQVVIVPATVASTAPVSNPAPPDPRSPPPTPANRDVHVAVVGDSVGYSLYFGRPRVVGMRLSAGVGLGCGAMAADYWVDNQVITPDLEGKHCQTLTYRWRLVAASQPDVVLLTLGAWEVYDHYVNGQRLNVGSAAYRRALLSSLEEELAILNSRRRPRIAMFNVPCYNEKDLMQTGDSLPRNDPKRVRWVNGVFSEFAARHRDQIQMIDYAKFACPGGHSVEKVGDTVLRLDGIHYSPTSSPIVWRWLAPQLLDLAHRARV